MSVSSSTGIMLDPVYTGKAAQGLVKELQNCPDKFKGDRILFLHTGKHRNCFFPFFNSVICQGPIDCCINQTVTLCVYYISIKSLQFKSHISQSLIELYCSDCFGS